MKQKLFSITFVLVTMLSFSQPATNDTSKWTVTNITSNNAFNYPWELTYMPGDKLWLTERVGEKISSFKEIHGNFVIFLSYFKILIRI